MNLKQLQRNWNQLGEVDPYWAIRFDPSRKGNRWKPEEFFATGEQDVAEVMAYLERLGVEVQRGRALDFGCGVGRLTQALAFRFAEVHGVDIAPSMIELAIRHNRHGDRCHYHLNEAPDLRLFDDASFDFVYTILVLQHMENRYAVQYLAEFLRVLRPEGILVFGLPSHPTRTLRGQLFAKVPNPVLNAYRRLKYGCGAVMELHGMRRDAVVGCIERNGGTVIDISQEHSIGNSWHSYRYCVRKLRQASC